MKNVYLDYNATSPLRPEVLRAMEPYFKEGFGNPSSFHQMGQKARHALEDARKKLLGLLGKKKGEMIFTSCATEANNLALRGVGAGHFIASAIEHLSVLKPLEFVAKNGCELALASPDEEGIVSVSEVEKHLMPSTRLVSLMAANNETGTLQPVHELAKRLRPRGILFHVDAVQVFGRMKFDFEGLDADLISISAHKIGGPRGIGALWIREGLKIKPMLFGGHHENNLRAGTENLPAAVGFAKAAEAALSEAENDGGRISRLRDQLEAGILDAIPNVKVNGSRKSRLPNTLNVSFIGCDTESLLMLLDTNGIFASSGSACTSGSIDPSHVLRAMNLPKERLASAIRFSLGSATRKEEIEYLARRLPEWVSQIRKGVRS